MPATIHDGDVTIAIGTRGSAPALASEIKRQLLAGEPVPERIGEFASELAEIRGKLRGTDITVNERGRIMRCLARPEAYKIFISSGAQALREYLQKIRQESTEDAS